ncbi:hypothetical protein HPB50_011019 [Hyalomma asiaticum]|uniref:Uncharacterized protein n=1 Tax=Hyalomma asiaticum TaxID=266040 RepID=A0ACB7TMD3_HYAAI|nr:hypothetical protein HPB50_011019 [Hyalomma asiaticum]
MVAFAERMLLYRVGGILGRRSEVENDCSKLRELKPEKVATTPPNIDRPIRHSADHSSSVERMPDLRYRYLYPSTHCCCFRGPVHAGFSHKNPRPPSATADYKAKTTKSACNLGASNPATPAVRISYVALRILSSSSHRNTARGGEPGIPCHFRRGCSLRQRFYKRRAAAGRDRWLESSAKQRRGEVHLEKQSRLRYASFPLKLVWMHEYQACATDIFLFPLLLLLHAAGRADAVRWLLSRNRRCEVSAAASTCPEAYWQSDGPQPHLVNDHFRRKTTIQGICIYADYKLDESYTPNRISVRVGSSFHDLQVLEAVDF